MILKRVLVNLTTGISFASAALAGILGAAAPVQAGGDKVDGEPARIRRGFEIAPVPLNLEHRNPQLVGLGSYLVNAVGSCNLCHSAGTSTEFAPGGNPYFKGSPQVVVNQATYLGGGRIFASQVAGATPAIVSRNLTPDRTGRPVGGRTFPEFLDIMQTGVDLDHVHPNCADPATSTSSSCFPVPLSFNGDVLQIMPWPSFRNMTEYELRAIYEYLSAIPCITGPATGILHNDCQ